MDQGAGHSHVADPLLQRLTKIPPAQLLCRFVRGAVNMELLYPAGGIPLPDISGGYEFDKFGRRIRRLIPVPDRRECGRAGAFQDPEDLLFGHAGAKGPDLPFSAAAVPLSGRRFRAGEKPRFP